MLAMSSHHLVSACSVCHGPLGKQSRSPADTQSQVTSLAPLCSAYLYLGLRMPSTQKLLWVCSDCYGQGPLPNIWHTGSGKQRTSASSSSTCTHLTVEPWHGHDIPSFVIQISEKCFHRNLKFCEMSLLPTRRHRGEGSTRRAGGLLPMQLLLPCTPLHPTGPYKEMASFHPSRGTGDMSPFLLCL